VKSYHSSSMLLRMAACVFTLEWVPGLIWQSSQPTPTLTPTPTPTPSRSSSPLLLFPCAPDSERRRLVVLPWQLPLPTRQRKRRASCGSLGLGEGGLAMVGSVSARMGKRRWRASSRGGETLLEAGDAGEATQEATRGGWGSQSWTGAWRAGFFCSPPAVQRARSGGGDSPGEQCRMAAFGKAELCQTGP
jgi:hypothetical protein